MDSDPDIEFIEKDSGMSSLGGSKDETPERRAAPPTQPSPPPTTTTTTVAARPTGDVENYDDEPDETIAERLWGLAEMFPNCVRNFTGKVTNLTVNGVKNVYSFSCNASWIFFTSSIILFAPVFFETERAQMEEDQKSRQKQVLFGPGAAAASTTGPTTPAPPLPSLR